MINQDELFGKATKAFTVATLMKISEEDKKNKDHNFTKTKQKFFVCLKIKMIIKHIQNI